MKKFILRFLCVLCVSGVLMSCLSFGVLSPVNADVPTGKMSSVYGYILNDYIETFGVLSENASGYITDSRGELTNPGGIIYGDIMNFDNNDCPYLVIFVAGSEYRTASCHIWMYSDETEQASRIAIIEKRYDDIPGYGMGELSMAWSSDRKYIVYKQYENSMTTAEEYYTVINGETFMLVNNPTDVSSTGITGFNTDYVNSGVDITNYNKTLDEFFSKLKDTASDSVTYDDISNRLSETDRSEITRTLIKAALHADLDISKYSTDADYQSALAVTSSSAKFTGLSAFYDLGDGIYYARFDTDKTVYNYAILRKSDESVSGYQLLKVRMDGIPLADRELRQMKLKYMQSPLLYPQSETGLKLTRATRPEETAAPEQAETITVIVNGETIIVPIATNAPEYDRLIEPVISIEKVFDDRIKLPAICIGSGLAAALLTILWVYMFSNND